jgi:hypothetical protein
VDADIQQTPHIESFLKVSFNHREIVPKTKNMLQALGGENRKSVSDNLVRFHNALQLLGATATEVNRIWRSVAFALDLNTSQLANVETHLKEVLYGGIDFSQASSEVPHLLNPFNDVSNPVLNVNRNHYFNAVETITSIVQR